jgi:thiol-disulfide isomerase/thioredoxin
MASLGNKRADGMLVLLVEKLKDDKRPRIVVQVRFLKMEQEMLKIDELPLEQLPGKLDAMQQYLAAEKLLGRHLRIASATVHGINRIEDPEQKEKYFQAFGKIFATSTDKTLASYGRKIASSPSSSPSDLVGKPLTLEGETELGIALDWKSYRGKVVLLDFWATWCGPCLREMPNVRAIHKRLEKQGFTVLAVNLDRNQEDLAKFLEENDVPWTNLIAEGARKAATRYGVRAIPTMMVIDQQGNVAAVAHRVAEVSGTIEKLLKKPEQK